MGKKSSIQWTDDTDNIIVVKDGGWWCRMFSEGCRECYAAKLNQNAFYGGNKLAYTGVPPELILRHDMLVGWSRQRRSRLHFVASMTDVFGDWVSHEWQFRMLDFMEQARGQIFQILTKRPKIMLEVVEAWLAQTGRHQVPKNIWLGCSVENQKWADIRMEPMACLAGLGAITWVSYEPALGPVNWKGWGFIRQIISGGESGPGARPSHPDWHRATRDWCAANGDVAYFFKQWGEFWPLQIADHAIVVTKVTVAGKTHDQFHDWKDGYASLRLGKKTSGRGLDGRTHEQFPAYDHPALAGREQIKGSAA
jgi:protein gp37